AMSIMRIPPNEQSEIFATLSGLLHLGNVDFEVLTTKEITAGTETYTTQLNPSQAADARDALAKSIYGRLFLWLVSRINRVISAEEEECLDLIEGRKPPGLLALLDEQCLMPQGGDEGLARKYYENLKEHERFKATAKQQVAAKFTIRHYAGNVEYSTNKFCDKNK
ncbi:MIC, partial [Symbiodinium sp. KB8]